MRGCRICSSARFFFSVGKDYRPKCAPIQIAIRRKNLFAKFLPHEVAHGGILVDELPGGAVGVEKLRAQRLAQTIAESRFAGGNATGDPDDGCRFRHGKSQPLVKESDDRRNPCLVCKLPVTAADRMLEGRSATPSEVPKHGRDRARSSNQPHQICASVKRRSLWRRATRLMLRAPNGQLANTAKTGSIFSTSPGLFAQLPRMNRSPVPLT